MKKMKNKERPDQSNDNVNKEIDVPTTRLVLGASVLLLSREQAIGQAAIGIMKKLIF